MDVCKIEHPMDISSLPANKTPDGTLLSRKIGTKDVCSISVTPGRSTSPRIIRTSSTVSTFGTKRAVSAEPRPPSPMSRTSLPASPSLRSSTRSSASPRNRTPVQDVLTDRESFSLRLSASKAPDGLWPSMRSLSSSFQSELPSVSRPIIEREKVSVGSVNGIAKSRDSAEADRKRSFTRGTKAADQTENSQLSENCRLKVIDQHRWPSMKLSASSMSRSSDFTDKVSRPTSSLASSRPSSPGRVLENLIDKGSKSVSSKNLDLRGRIQRHVSPATPRRGLLPRIENSDNMCPRSPDMSEKANISVERTRRSINSSTTAKVVSTIKKVIPFNGRNAMSRSLDITDKVTGMVKLSTPSRGASPRRMVSDDLSKDSQFTLSDAVMRLRKDENARVSKAGLTSDTMLSDGSDELKLSANGRNAREDKTCTSSDSSSSNSERLSSLKKPSRTLSTPIIGLRRPSSPSPSRVQSTSSPASRRMQSAPRTGPPVPASFLTSNSPAAAATSILHYIADVRKGMKNANHMEDAHHLRILYNRELQWRFVNSYADEALTYQRTNAESTLYSIWNCALDLHNSVTSKRMKLQQKREEIKLRIILGMQVKHLDYWAVLEHEHFNSLAGLIESLKANTLTIPLTQGAKADVLALKSTVSSAIETIQAMGSSICHFLSMVDNTSSLVAELSVLTRKELIMLEQCRDLLATVAALQAQECSLRTQLLQSGHDVPEMQ